MFIEEVFPHVELLSAELRDHYSKFHDQIAKPALISRDSSIFYQMFHVFGCQAPFSLNFHLLTIKMLKFFCEAKQRLF